MDKPFWGKKWGKDMICPISQSRLRPGKNKHNIPHVRKLKCGHRFWRKAIDNWVITQCKNRNQLSCPVCRCKFSLRDYMYYYENIHNKKII